MRVMNHAILATTIMGLGLGMSPDSRAVTQSIFAYTNPGGACQLSIPTTDTKVRPKATGFRNEGTTNAFAICGYSKVSSSTNLFKSIVIGLVSFDGANHDVTCTAVTGLSGVSGADLVYSSISVAVTGTGSVAFQIWGPADFGMPGPTITGAYEPSVTCLLPPNVAIVYQAGNFDIDVGN